MAFHSQLGPASLGAFSLGAEGSDIPPSTISPSAIASAESFGTAAISGTATLSPSGIASAEAFGTLSVDSGIGISPTSIDSAEAFGTAELTVNYTLSPSSIASAESFGTLAIEGAATLSPSSIDSAEAFGTAAIGSVLEVSPGGIDSAEAFGTLSMRVDYTLVPTSIASAESFGTAALFGSTKGRILIAGRDRTGYLHHESDYSWNLMKGSRGTCSIPLILEPGDAFAPQTGELIEIFDPVDVRVWIGTIEQVFVRWFGDKGNHLLVITGISLESLFDTAFVDKTRFDGVTGAGAFTALYTASGVTFVTLGTVDTGETIDALEVTRISDGLSAIALRSNKIWFVDPADITLNMVGAVDIPAPWVMGSTDIVWETIQWRQSRADFRDTQVIQSPDGTTQTIIAVTPNDSLGRRAARLTLTTGYSSAGGIQEATAALRRFSTLPSQLVVSTDRPGVSIGMLLEIDADYPLEAGGLINGFWQVTEVEARMLTGMDDVDVVQRRLPTDLSLGHFRYTLHLINSLALAIFQGDGTTTVFHLPVTPGSVSYIRVSPDGELYAVSSSGDEVTIEPAMPEGTYGLVGYEGEGTPDVSSFVDVWKNMVPTAASAGPATGGTGGGSQTFIAPLLLSRLTIDDDIAPHVPIYHEGIGTRVLVVLRKLLGADLIVRLMKSGDLLVTIVIPATTAVDDVIEYPLSARQVTVTAAGPAVFSVTDAVFVNGDAVVLHSSGALPSPLLEDTPYYVVNTAGAVFELALSPGGASLDTTGGTQSGNHWLTSIAIDAPAFAEGEVLTADILDSDEAIDRNGIAALGVQWDFSPV